MDTTIKVDKELKEDIKVLKELIGVRSQKEVLEWLIDKELDNYCRVRDGYAKIGDVLNIDGTKYMILDITQEGTVYARSNDKVIEFFKKGKVAWEATKCTH